MDFTEEFTKEQEQELINEIKQDEANEIKQEQQDINFLEWFKDNENGIKQEFIEMYADEFLGFAKDCFRRETE